MDARTLYDKAVAAGLPMPGFHVGTYGALYPLPGLGHVASLADVAMAVVEGLAAHKPRYIYVTPMLQSMDFVAGTSTAYGWEVHGVPALYPKRGDCYCPAQFDTLPDALAAACDILAARQPAK